MRGDFLGQVTLSWDDLEVGRELDLALMQRKGARGKSVQGTIKLLVGEPVIEVNHENAILGGMRRLQAFFTSSVQTIGEHAPQSKCFPN